MKFLFAFSFCLISLLATAQQKSGTSTIPAAKSAFTRKIEGLLAKTSYQLEKLDSNIWTIPFKGNSIEDIQVVITESNGLTVFFSIVVPKATDSISADRRLKVLQYNMDFDRVKIGIDEDDNLLVRIDLSSRIADLKELEAHIEQIAAAADEVHALIKQQ